MRAGVIKSPKPDSVVTRQAIIDELGEVERQFKLWTPGVNPYASRLAELNAIVDGWYLEADPDSTDIQEGARYRLEVKPCQFKRELTAKAQAAAFARLKKVKIQDGSGRLVPLDLLSLFKLTQATILKYLGEQFLDEIAPARRTGKRTYRLLPKAGPMLMKTGKEAA
jgi:hypothetical protein